MESYGSKQVNRREGMDTSEAGVTRRYLPSRHLMANFAEHWIKYRRLLYLTFVPLIGCVAFVVMLGSGFNEKQHPTVFGVAGALDAICFLAFCYNGLRLSFFRCPRCAEYFSRGKMSHVKRDGFKRCRHCGLRLYGEA
jgi:hypothetical protein